MKKIILLLISISLLTGCVGSSKDDIVEDFMKDVEDASSYSLKASMEILNNEDTYTYAVEVNYKQDDFYKVHLVNQTNDHEQIILKNKEGVYVITPSLNKSFKFQSNWPKSSSQSYLLGPIVDDMKQESTEVTEDDNNYIVKTTVNYPNNEELTYELIYLDKKGNLEKIEIYNKNDELRIKVVFNNIDYKAKFTEDDFVLEDLIDEDNVPSTEGSVGSIEDIIYPLYIPANTYLKDQETITTGDSERTILTFAGEKNFVLVEEVSKPSEEFEIIPVYGDPFIIGGNVGSMSANSLSWTQNNIDYYLASSDLNNTELMTIAESLNNNGVYITK